MPCSTFLATSGAFPSTSLSRRTRQLVPPPREFEILLGAIRTCARPEGSRLAPRARTPRHLRASSRLRCHVFTVGWMPSVRLPIAPLWDRSRKAREGKA
eukprot:scaffold17_cov354-Pavlova_lutheri.AAC.43